MKARTKIRRSVRAVSKVISVLLLIAIAVAAALIAYAWLMGYIGGTTIKTQKAIQIQSIAADNNDNLLVYVQNIGVGTVQLNPDSVYVKDVLRGIDNIDGQSLGPSDTVPVIDGKTVKITVLFTVPFNEPIKIKVVTSEGVFVEYTGTIKSEGEAASPTNSRPTAAFTFSPSDPGVGTTVFFTDWSTDSDGSVVAWTWTFGDGDSSSARSPTHQYAAAGTFVVGLTVTDDDDATNYVGHSVPVSATAPANLAPTAAFTYSPLNPMVGDIVSFTDASTDSDGSVSAWSWNFGDSGTSLLQNPTHSYSSAGTYAVRLMVTDDDGASNYVERSVIVTATPPTNLAPTAAFTFSPSDPGVGTTVSFTEWSSDSDGSIVAWSWTFGDGDTSTARNPTHSYASANTYAVRLTVIDDDGASNYVERSVIVTATPPTNLAPTAAFTFSPPNPAVGDTVTFTDVSTDSDGSVVGWAWTFGDGGTSTAQNPTHTYSSAATYVVGLTVTDDDGATSYFGHSVPVSAASPVNVAPTAAFTFSPPNPAVGDTVSFTDGSTDSDGSVVAWTWDFGDGSTSALQNPTHPYGSSGTYPVELTVTDDDGATNYIEHNVPVSATPGSPVSITINSNPTGSAFVKVDGNPITTPQTFNWMPDSTHTLEALSPISGGAGIQYAFAVWSDGGGQTHTYTVPASGTTVTGNYQTQYYLTVNSAHGAPSGQGWYNKDATAYAGLDSGTVSGGTGIQYVFTSWGTDASGTNYAQSNAITMSGPKTATANWQTQYFLTVSSAYGTVGGEGWYDSGATAYATVTPLTVAGPTDTQYVFTQWSDGASGTTSPSDPITMNAPKTATANWQAQYFLTVSSAYGTPSGQGWYNSGAVTYAGLDIGEIDHGNGTKHMFTSWGTDASGSNYVQSDAITMSSPKTATANWQTQYSFTITSDRDSPTPASGWFNSGTSITTSVTSPADESDGTRYTCTGWTGTGSVPTSGSDTSTSFNILAPSSITWNWQTQYRLTMATNFGTTTPVAGDTWYDAGSVVTISATAPSTIAGERYVWNAWAGTGSGSYSGTDNPATNAVTMNAPITETAAWIHQYQVTFAANPAAGGYTTPLDPTWYTAGSSGNPISASNNPSYTFSSWSASPISSIEFGSTTSSSTTIKVNGAGTITANFAPIATGYTLTINIIGNGQVSRIPDQTTYAPGTSVQLTAIPANGYRFTGWSGALGGSTNPASITMDSDKTVTATFAPATETSISWWTWPGQVTLGQNFASVGILNPGLNDRTIVLTFTRPDGTKIVSNTNTFWFIFSGVFYAQLKPDMVGQWTVTAQFLGDETYAAFTTAPQTFQVV
jgi:uncharacterized repeat protein (TIGR02543 family)